MINIEGGTNQIKIKQRNSDTREPQPFSQTPIDGGMVTSKVNIDIQPNQAILLQNFDTRFGKTSRRDGTKTYPVVKLNSQKILNLITYDKTNGDSKIIRFAQSSIYSGSATLWTQIVPAVALNGGANDRISATILEDRFFFANNGADVIQELSTATNTCAALGNAAKYKYLLGLNGRILALNLITNFTAVAWSGFRNYAVWDSITDATAGSTILTDSGSNLADPITGGVAFENNAIIFRERSIWDASVTNSPTQPFYFVQKVPNVGSDCPRSITQIPSGACFVDTRTKSVYAYFNNGTLKILSDDVNNILFDSISDKTQVIGTYSNSRKEYHCLIINSLSQQTLDFVYSFETETWRYDTYFNTSTIANLNYNSSTVAIDDLVGSISSLLGTIASLTPSVTSDTLFIANITGDIYFRQDGLSTDGDVNNPNYEAIRISNAVELPNDAEYINELDIEYVPVLGNGAFTISYSKDNGNTYIILKTITWNNSTDIGLNKRLFIKKPVRTRTYLWKISSTSGLFNLIKYIIKLDTAGLPKK